MLTERRFRLLLRHASIHRPHLKSRISRPGFSNGQGGGGGSDIVMNLLGRGKKESAASEANMQSQFERDRQQGQQFAQGPGLGNLFGQLQGMGQQQGQDQGFQQMFNQMQQNAGVPQQGGGPQQSGGIPEFMMQMLRGQ